MSVHLLRRIVRLHPTLIALSAIAALCACTPRKSTRDGPVQESAYTKLADGSAVGQETDPDLLKGWTAETFALPPAFAPKLPTGRESLRFPPGWRDPSADNFWSYAFVMWIDESAPNEARMKELLEQYYDGLMSSFAAGTNKDISSTPARVEVVRAATSSFEVKMRLIDAFATFKPIDLRVAIDSSVEADGHTVLQIQVSPQPTEHAIWRSLQAAIGSIVSRDR